MGALGDVFRPIRDVFLSDMFGKAFPAISTITGGTILEADIVEVDALDGVIFDYFQHGIAFHGPVAVIGGA